MVIVGVTCILVYFFAPGKQLGFGWFFVEGLTTFVLGSLVLANKLPTDLMVPVFFGLWLLFSGILRMVASVHLVLEKHKSWLLTLIAGGVSATFGVYAFFNQVMETVIPLMILVGIIFMLQGINILIYGVYMARKERRFKLFGRLRTPKNERIMTVSTEQG
jgi:uncharacterized membrane protein HdeD (DUF308 family)